MKMRNGKRVRMEPPRCYCTDYLRPDGTCRHGCPPELRKPRARAKELNKKIRAQLDHKRSAEWIGLNLTDVRTKAAAVVPALARVAIKQELRRPTRKRWLDKPPRRKR